MTKYVISDMNNGSHDFCEDLEDAAHTILTHDDYEYDIREDSDGGYRLWTSSRSRNASGGFKMEGSVIFSLKPNKEEASQEIHKQVCDGIGGEVFGAANATYCQTLDDYISDLRSMISDFDADDDDDYLEGLKGQLEEALAFRDGS